MEGPIRKYTEFVTDLAKSLGCDPEALSYRINFDVEFDNDGQLIIYTGIFLKSRAVDVNTDISEISYIEDEIKNGDL